MSNVMKGFKMHTKNMLCLTVLLGLLIVAGTISAQEIEYERITVGTGRHLRWSPDGKYLSFIAGRSGGPLYLYEVATGETTQLGIAPTYHYDWLTTDRLIFNRKEWVRKDKHRIVELSTLSLDGVTMVIESDTLPYRSRARVGQRRLRRLSNGQIIPTLPEQTDVKKLSLATTLSSIDTSAFFVIKNGFGWTPTYWGEGEPDEDLWLIRADGQPFKRITYGQGYGVPWLSPDGQFVCGLGNGTTIFNHDGDIVGKLVGSSGLSSWLSDNMRLVFERVEFGEPDGQNLVASELFIADYTGKNEIQITNTPDIIEHQPIVSPDDSMIAYINYLTFEIEILKVAGGL